VGKDWDSTIPYYSERFTVMIPDWLPGKYSYLTKEEFDPIKDRKVGGFVFCPVENSGDSLSEAQVISLTRVWNLSKFSSFSGCHFYFLNN
jgi:hypothetical protein